MKVGKFLSYTPGVVTYFTGTSPPSSVPFFVVPVAVGVGGGVLVLFLVMVVVMVVVIVRYKWDSTKKSHQVDNLLMMLETWETNMADECKRGNVCVFVCMYLCVYMYVYVSIHVHCVHYCMCVRMCWLL